MTFVATWTPVSYKVVYDVDGGVALPDSSYNIETALTTCQLLKEKDMFSMDGIGVIRK